MMIKEFKIIKNSEKVHYWEDSLRISSFFNIIYYSSNLVELKIVLPLTIIEKFLGLFRITRRLFRLDMCNVFLCNSNLIIMRNGIVYNYNLEKRKLCKTLELKQCRNILHQSMCQTKDGQLYFGEYGMNPNREAVNVYRSQDNGESWNVIYTFPAGKIRHVHGCYYDKYSNKIWTLTGDFEGENIIQSSNLDFKEIEIFGDGSQSFRAVSLFFSEREVSWIMDSPLEKNYQFCYDRYTGAVKRLDYFNGPVWYLKELDDGYYLAGSSVEIGDGVLSDKACLYLSKDLKKWEIICEFSKDKWPMPYFKWGVLSFSNGCQTIDNFTLHFEGLNPVDGKAFVCSISK